MKPFNFDEFCNRTGDLYSNVMTPSSNGGITSNLVLKQSGIILNLQEIGSDTTDIGFKPQINTSHIAFTQVAIPSLLDTDVLRISGVDYAVIGIDVQNQFVGSYIVISLEERDASI